VLLESPAGDGPPREAIAQHEFPAAIVGRRRIAFSCADVAPSASAGTSGMDVAAGPPMSVRALS
jgi:hypothetical protein